MSTKELDSLWSDISAMGGMAEEQLTAVIGAVERRDPAACAAVRSRDSAIDLADQDIEDKVMELLAGRKVTMDDARIALSCVKISRELERVGDLAKNIAKRAMVLAKLDQAEAMSGVLRMGRKSRDRLAEALDACAHQNIDKAVAVWSGDDEIDELFNSLYKNILQAMMADASNVNACTHLVFIAKNFERVGDHATNVAESVYFCLTGERLEEARPKTDETSSFLVKRPATEEIVDS